MTEFLEAVELWVEATLQAPEHDLAVRSLTESFLREG